MARSFTPRASNSPYPSRNCERCLRQNGQENPRKKTSTTGLPLSADSRTVLPSIAVSSKSGAAAPTGTVSLSTGMARPILGYECTIVKAAAWLCYHHPAHETGANLRLIVFTGKGGSGASTLAAGTAAIAAEAGQRTVAFGLGRGLGVAFDARLASDPAVLSDSLPAP